MNDKESALWLIRLQAWMSPSFPTGGFAYSQGLESAVHDGLVRDQDSLKEWLSGLLISGSLRNDVVFLKEAWALWDQRQELFDINELALAMSVSKERQYEMIAQGEAFSLAIKNWELPSDLTLPKNVVFSVAVGAVAGAFSIPASSLIAVYLHSFINNQCQAAIRLSLIGQTGAATILAQLEEVLAKRVVDLKNATIDDLGSASFQADIMAINHEVQEVRLFRS